MKLVLAAFAALSLLGACASAPETETTTANDRASCRNVEPPTGSRLVRKADCAAAPEAKP
jgi:hypothetical protein